MKYIILLILVAGICSCEDFLTIRPKSDITEDDLFATSEGVEDALYGVYARMGHTDLYGSDMTWGVVDLLPQYFKLDGNQGTNRLQVGQFQHESKGARELYESIWTGMYQTIGYTNNLINSLLKKDESSMRYYSLYLGEALGIRAFLHFDLVRLFAPHVERQPDERGIPYVRQWTSKVTPFSTVKEVYASVLQDLKESERLLAKATESMDRGNDFTSNPKIHFNLQAAHALLARVYWMKGDLDSACIYARKVIDSGQFRLAEMAEIKNIVAQIVAKKEGIFGIFNNQLTDKYKLSFYGMSGGVGDATLYPNMVWDLYENLYPTGNGDNEMRLGWFRTKVNDSSGKNYFMKLFLEENMGADRVIYGNGNTAGINLIRLPEMYLIVAEALLEKEPDVALEYFDTFIASRGLMKFKDRNKALTLMDIAKERKREFFGEGQEFYNMKREMRSFYLTSYSWKYMEGNEEMYTIPIPDSEFEFRYDGMEETNVN